MKRSQCEQLCVDFADVCRDAKALAIAYYVQRRYAEHPPATGGVYMKTTIDKLETVLAKYQKLFGSGV